MAGSLGSGVYSEATYGSVTHKDKLSLTVRHQSQPLMQFASLTKAAAALGAHKGDTVYLPKSRDISQSTSTVPEFNSLPVKQAPINEVAVTVNEYGCSVEYSGRAKLYAEYNLEEVMRTVIANNIAQSKDKIVGDIIQAVDAWVVPTAAGHAFDIGASAPDSAADEAFSGSVSRAVRKKFRQDDVPTWDGKYYLQINSPGAHYQMLEDTAAGSIQDWYKYAVPEQLIMNEIGEYFGFRMIEETNVLSDTLGTSGFEGEALFLGGDVVAEAIAMPEVVKTDMWNYDRFYGIAWHMYCGWSLIWNFTDDAEYHIMRASST